MRKVHVGLGKRSYDIFVGRRSLPDLGQHCRRLGLGPRCAILTDDRVGPRYGAATSRLLRQAGFDPVVITVPAGERAKCVRQLALVYDQLAAHRLERKSFILALGGGVVGDLAGFAAATYLRGIPFVQVPTTLVGQVDSSVGGKTGVNLSGGKNLVGAFWQPRLVVCDLEILRTLPDREFRSGLAEVIKYGLICDIEFFNWLEANMASLVAGDQQCLARAIYRSCEIKAEVVARCCVIKAEVVGRDETESGLRAILNFGHTIGHALEAITRYGQYLHGEAIAIGQVLAARLSHRLLDLPGSEVQRIERLFQAAGLPVGVRLSERQRERLLTAMRLDKKVAGGQSRFVLAERIGRARFGEVVPASVLDAVLMEISESSRGTQPG